MASAFFSICLPHTNCIPTNTQKISSSHLTYLAPFLFLECFLGNSISLNFLIRFDYFFLLILYHKIHRRKMLEMFGIFDNFTSIYNFIIIYICCSGFCSTYIFVCHLLKACVQMIRRTLKAREWENIQKKREREKERKNTSTSQSKVVNLAEISIDVRQVNVCSRNRKLRIFVLWTISL